MTKNLFLISFLILLFPQELFSQDDLKSNFQLGANYYHVANRLRSGSDVGIGLSLEYHFPLVKSIGIEGVAGLGYDRLLNCSICSSEWFENGYWGGVGLSKIFMIKGEKTILAQMRYRIVGFQRTEAFVIDTDGTIEQWQVSETSQGMLGFRLGYYLPINVPLIFSYTNEMGTYHRINSFSLAFQF